MKKFSIKFIGVVIAIFFVIVAFNVQMSDIFSLPSEALVTYEDVEDINKQQLFGKFISANITEKQVGGEDVSNTKLVFKLFGLLPIKTIEVQVSDGKEVYVGGIPLGFAINTQGVIIVGDNVVQTENGSKLTTKTKELKSGDVLCAINGNKVCSVDDVISEVNKSNGARLTLDITRDNKEHQIEIIPEKDISTNEYKLGLWVKDDASGVGTLTFVNTETMRYGALGHPITDFETGIEIPVLNGKIYKCNLIGITKGQKGNPGELRCLFMQGNNDKGSVDTNCKYGVYGEVKEDSIIDKNLCVNIGSRMCVKPGKAKLVSSVSGVQEEYDIEIIKASYQPKSSDKSMVIRVTDSRLLNLTGGIVQGMSGSPILQNGKLVGAVTHVFLSDPTKGYAIYADWMLENA